MLPTFVNEFEAIAIGVQDICSVIARVIVEPYTGCAIIGCARCDRGGISGFNLLPAAVTVKKLPFRLPRYWVVLCWLAP